MFWYFLLMIVPIHGGKAVRVEDRTYGSMARCEAVEENTQRRWNRRHHHRFRLETGCYGIAED